MRWALALVLTFAFPATALAGPRTATFSTGDVSVAGAQGSFCVRTGSSGRCGDSPYLNGPKVFADPGATVTITLDGDVDTFDVSFLAQSSTMTPRLVAPRTYAVTLPPRATLPKTLVAFARFHGDDESGDRSWYVEVEPVPPPKVSAVRLHGRRLSATITCRTACQGTLSLKAAGLRVARIEYTRAGAVRTTIRASALRHLRRHHTQRLRAIVKPRGGRSSASTVRLRS